MRVMSGDGDRSESTAVLIEATRARTADASRNRRGRRAVDGSVKQGQHFRIVDLEGNQAVDTLFYRAGTLEERYSAQDTIRAQGNIYLTTGTALLSNEGNTMLTIVADTCGRHDTLGGACSAESNTVRYALEKRTCTAAATISACARALGLAVRSRLQQTRPCEQHQFLHERACDAGRQAHLRRRHLGARAATSRCARRWT